MGHTLFRTEIKHLWQNIETSIYITLQSGRIWSNCVFAGTSVSLNVYGQHPSREFVITVVPNDPSKVHIKNDKAHFPQNNWLIGADQVQIEKCRLAFFYAGIERTMICYKDVLNTNMRVCSHGAAKVRGKRLLYIFLRVGRKPDANSGPWNYDECFQMCKIVVPHPFIRLMVYTSAGLAVWAIEWRQDGLIEDQDLAGCIKSLHCLGWCGFEVLHICAEPNKKLSMCLCWLDPHLKACLAPIYYNKHIWIFKKKACLSWESKNGSSQSTPWPRVGFSLNMLENSKLYFARCSLLQWRDILQINKRRPLKAHSDASQIASIAIWEWVSTSMECIPSASHLHITFCMPGFPALCA